MDSKLELVCGYSYGRTNIDSIYYNPPYKIMHPFMDEDRMSVYLMSSSAGLLAGDSFNCSICVKQNACLSFFSQSYEKILDTKDDMAVKNISLQVMENASLKYLPYPAIPYKNSNFMSTNEARIAGSSTLIYSDIFSCGRVGMGERYLLKKYRSKTNIFIDEELIFSDHTLISPQEIDYEGLGMWGKYTHNGLLYIYSPNLEQMEEIIEKARKMSDDKDILIGATHCLRGVLLRSLGHSGEDLFELNRKIADMVI